MIEKLKDVRSAIKNKNYLSALALALTIPDICGGIEYAHIVDENGKRKVGTQYRKWFDNYVNQYYADSNGWNKSFSKAKKSYFTGYMCYNLRCEFLHLGAAEIGDFGKLSDDEFNYKYHFTLAVNGADSYGESWVEGDKIKNITVTVNIDTLCENICRAAENYYQMKDVSYFKKSLLNIIDYSL